MSKGADQRPEMKGEHTMKIKEFLNKLSMASDVRNVKIYSGDQLLTYLNHDDVKEKLYYGCGELLITTFRIDAYKNNVIVLYVKEK